ncbi:sensor histidine kinase [Azohydromonas caseinilytica]|uniref:Virulence sensor protein BvgS n=1 Tax=Azohydromonas caseinilytica TaxID=2728836 RepID=A0A848FD09_9BURK|nr:ATP-binding protein [Azohydromonas caseinilytica]NML17238.1 hypothetical protein [Azohydromonas caseinilytica]
MSSTEALPAPRSTRQPERLREMLVLVAGGVLMLALSLTSALMLWRQREDALATWRLYMDNYSATVAEHARQVVRTANTALGSVVEQVQAQDGDSEARLREIAGTRRMFDFLRERRVEAGLAGDVAVVDLQGQILVNSQAFPPPHVNVHDRDYFKAHLAQPALETFVSAPVLSRDTGRWTFFLSRKIRSRSGHTLGLAITGVEVAYFDRFYGSINLSPEHTAILLLRRDGTLLVRHPQRPGAMTASYRDGPALRALTEALLQGRRSVSLYTETLRAADPGEADARLAVAQALDDYPLAVITTVTETLMLRAWRQTAWLVGLGTLALDAVIAALALWTYVVLRRRRAAIRELATANREKTEFLSTISQEIRAPLHGLLGMTRRLAAALPPLGAQRKELQAMERSNRLLLALVDDLLDYARLEAGRLELERVPFTLAAVAQECVGLFEAEARAKGLKLELYMGAAASGAPVLGDPVRLAQILHNLLSNALRFTLSGSVALGIVPLGPGRWRLTVTDTGVGMTTQQRRRIFEPFTRAEGAPAQGGGGIGLGLSIVKRLVQLHGGTLGVRSEPGQGSEFWCELPLPPAPAEAVAAQTHAEAKVDAEERAPG